MDYSQLKKELLPHLRGRIPQSQVDKKLGVTFTKTYRWESGTTHLMWSDFVSLCIALKIPINDFLKEAFTYHGEIKSSAPLVQHLTGTSTQKEILEVFQISRYTLSRWLSGFSEPTFEQMLALMDFGSPDFLRFLELITAGTILPSTQERTTQDRLKMKHTMSYPWLPVLLSALELKSYRSNPSDQYLAVKTKLPIEEIHKALKELQESSIIEWTGAYWRTLVHRRYLQSSREDNQHMARYVFDTSLKAIDTSAGNKNMRLSWTIFSLNKKAYAEIIQRYTEFFNDLGKIVAANQEDADNIFLFSAGIIDYDHLKSNP
jgi:transcriptional regulator with XRE-family HTH domain